MSQLVILPVLAPSTPVQMQLVLQVCHWWERLHQNRWIHSHHLSPCPRSADCWSLPRDLSHGTVEVVRRSRGTEPSLRLHQAIGSRRKALLTVWKNLRASEIEVLPAKPLVLFGIQLLVAHLMVEMTVRLLGLKPLPLQLLQAQVLARPLQLVLCWKLWQLLQLLWVMMLQQQLAVAQVQQDLQCLRYLLHWWHLPLQVSLVSQQQKDLALVLPWRWGSYHLPFPPHRVATQLPPCRHH